VNPGRDNQYSNVS